MLGRQFATLRAASKYPSSALTRPVMRVTPSFRSRETKSWMSPVCMW